MSDVATTYQEGSVFQTGQFGAILEDRGEAALADGQDPGDVLRQVGGERLSVQLWGDRQLDRRLAIAEGVVAGMHRADQRRVAELGEDRAERFTLVERERGDVDEFDRATACRR